MPPPSLYPSQKISNTTLQASKNFNLLLVSFCVCASFYFCGQTKVSETEGTESVEDVWSIQVAIGKVHTLP